MSRTFKLNVCMSVCNKGEDDLTENVKSNQLQTKC